MKETISMLLLIAAIITFIICVISIIVKLFTKKPKKKIFVVMGIAVLLFVVALIMMPVDSENAVVPLKDDLHIAQEDFDKGNYDLGINNCLRLIEKRPDDKDDIIAFINENIAKYPTMTASELFAEYDANEVKADNDYKGKPVVITGTIDDIQKDAWDDIYVLLDNEVYDFACVQLQFCNEQNEAVAGLVIGDEVCIIGNCLGQSGVILDNVIIDNCYIINEIGG